MYLPLPLAVAGAERCWTFDDDDGISAPMDVGGGPGVVADTDDVTDEAVEYWRSQLLLLLLVLLLLLLLLLWVDVWSEFDELKPVQF